ncbi:MAG: hypothetical protein ACXVOH_03560 [Bacteroidia bacterium]
MANGNIAINGTQMLLAGAYDPSHGIGVFANYNYYNFSTSTSKSAVINGPVIYGYGGGALGTNQTVNNGNSGTGAPHTNVALAWNDAGQVFIGLRRPGNFPNAALTVDGQLIVSQDIWVADQAHANWADYVFKKEYKLMPLLEVEKYIKENGHLNNVPSAAEIKEKGQNLAGLQVTQMEKIEEHTLYLIEMRKEMNEMKKEIENLRKENEQLKKK